MFIRRLAESAKRTPTPVKLEVRKTPTNEEPPLPDKVIQAQKDLTVYKDKSDILDKLSEYLFDLFDANAMEDFAVMERFERRAVESFRQYERAEFTHEQHALHAEFVSIFERLIEGFLHSEDYSVQDFHEELVHFRAQSSNKLVPQLSKGREAADECLEVISSYMQFEVWAGLMQKQARQEHNFTLRGQQKALEKERAYADKKAASHRLGDCLK
ncbi:hypothetical protein B484DRAFT_186660 [Ochromonadaceae sp. CCMP2298]|nr:hypothetical protein B484DRAFT_186660 [Ochromonadaceae sp. CCMP2298]|mmetsp:Transcript_1883/g.4386  ORF Transcript_1883/g.4386 Transcript_1883/m.4386 type:complete len:214 (+) Transcript_1883:415-1056(+)